MTSGLVLVIMILVRRSAIPRGRQAAIAKTLYYTTVQYSDPDPNYNHNPLLTVTVKYIRNGGPTLQ